MEGNEKQERKRKIDEGELQPADILLVHARGSFWAWLIRCGTNSYWNHALVVCRVKGDKGDEDDILAVDAKTSGSIFVRKVSDYLSQPDKYDVAVKRLETDWFVKNGKSLVGDLRRNICLAALNEAQTPGNRLTSAANQFVRQVTILWWFFKCKVNRAYIPPQLPWSTRPSQLRAFTCSGFVQWCYYMGALKTCEEKGCDKRLLNDVVFSAKLEKEPTVFGLLTITPAELAESRKLSWKCVMTKGIIKEVSDNKDALSVAPI